MQDILERHSIERVLPQGLRSIKRFIRAWAVAYRERAVDTRSTVARAGLLQSDDFLHLATIQFNFLTNFRLISIIRTFYIFSSFPSFSDFSIFRKFSCLSKSLSIVIRTKLLYWRTQFLAYFNLKLFTPTPSHPTSHALTTGSIAVSETGQNMERTQKRAQKYVHIRGRREQQNCIGSKWVIMYSDSTMFNMPTINLVVDWGCHFRPFSESFTLLAFILQTHITI